MKTTAHILLATCLVLIAGCGEEEETFSRYPSVCMLMYEVEDHIRDLSDPNPEMVYNAICNLSTYAKGFGKMLCAEDADPDSAEHQQVEEVYRTVCTKLESKESMVVAASLRFLHLFSRDYKPKQELVPIACRVENNHPLVRFEQIELLSRVLSEESQVPAPLLQSLLNHKSWIVSRSAYELVGALKDEPLRAELIRRYREATDERDRLLLILAMDHRLEAEEARLLEEEVLGSESEKIQYVARMTLMNNVECLGVKEWFLAHYPEFSDDVKDELFSECYDIELTCQLIVQGYSPDDKFLKRIIGRLSDKSQEDDRADALRIEEALLAVPNLAERWQALKNETEQESRELNALRDETAPIAEEVAEKIKEFMAEHEISASQKTTVQQTIDKALAPLWKKEKSADSPEGGIE